MINFEKDILNALYPSSANEPMLVEIDFSKAVKTYPYTPEDLVNQLENETMLSDLQSKKVYSWKVPVAARSDGYDYAVIDKHPDGSLSYSTVNTGREGAKQVDYLFNPNLISDVMAKEGIDQVNNLYVLSVSKMNMDLLVMNLQGGLVFIPFASRPDLMEMDNGLVYTSAEMMELIQKMETSSSGDALGGGDISKTEPKGNTVNQTAPIALVLGAILITVKIVRNRKRQDGQNSSKK